MKIGRKALLAAAILIFAGIVLSLAAMAAAKFDLGALSTMSISSKTYPVHQDFSDISVTSTDCSVTLLPSEDGACKVVCTESKNGKVYHTVNVSNDTLRIEQHDDRRWYEYIGISFDKMEIAVYLPQSEYESLKIRTASGSIDVGEEFAFANADLASASGSIRFPALTEKDLSVETASGSIRIENASPETLKAESASGSIKIESLNADTSLNVKTASGSIKLTSILCRELSLDTASGGLTLNSVIASGQLCAESTSGSVNLDGCDAGSLYIQTSSGSVHGSLLSDKIFTTKTSSGSVDVPRSVSGGECEVRTSSGSIKLTIE